MIPVGDEPVAGLYKTRLVPGGPPVAVRIWFGLPVIDGEEQDRAPQWCVEIDGRTDKIERDDDTGYCCAVPLDPMTVWPFCAASEIDEREYLFLLRRKSWAIEHAPTHPAARPFDRIDVRALKPGVPTMAFRGRGQFLCDGCKVIESKVIEISQDWEILSTIMPPHWLRVETAKLKNPNDVLQQHGVKHFCPGCAPLIESYLSGRRVDA